MRVLRFIYIVLAQSYYEVARRQINPMHPDLPRIVVRQRELEDAARKVFV